MRVKNVQTGILSECLNTRYIVVMLVDLVCKPHQDDVEWECWRNGGLVVLDVLLDDKKKIERRGHNVWIGKVKIIFYFFSENNIHNKWIKDDEDGWVAER